MVLKNLFFLAHTEHLDCLLHACVLVKLIGHLVCGKSGLLLQYLILLFH
jgi:hypothetical protein